MTPQLNTQLQALTSQVQNIATTQGQTAVMIERLSNHIEMIGRRLDEHEKRDDAQPGITAGWMNGWGAVLSVVVALSCGGLMAAVEVVSVVWSHLAH